MDLAGGTIWPKGKGNSLIDEKQAEIDILQKDDIIYVYFLEGAGLSQGHVLGHTLWVTDVQ